MFLARFTRMCLPAICRETSCDINKSVVGKVQRNFGLSHIRWDKSGKNLDQIRVDSLSKVALVLDKKYKTMKDVPLFLPYGVVYKARDRFRVKASIASGVFVLFLMIYLIRRAQRIRSEEEYEGMKAVEEARQKKQVQRPS